MRAGLPVRLERRGHVAWVVLERPEKLNALDEGMWRGLAEAVRSGCREASMVALRGSGRAFCTGDDIAAMLGLGGLEEARRFFAVVADAVSAIAGCGRPVAALVHGYAYGGCAEILLLMDLVVAVKGARIGFPEARLNLIPPLLVTLGARLLGRRVLRLALAVDLDAEEAAGLGLVDHVVDSVEEGVRLVEEYAERVSRLGAEAVASARRLALRSMGVEAVREALEVLARLVVSGEARERMRAFLEKRLR